MKTDLSEIRQNAEMILLAELAAFLHNLGKCHERFIDGHSARPSQTHSYKYNFISETMRRWIDEVLKHVPKNVEKYYIEAQKPETRDTLPANFRDQFFWNTRILFPNTIHDLNDADRKPSGYPIGFFIDFHREKRWGWFNFGEPPGSMTPLIKDFFCCVDRPLRLAQICHALCSISEQEFEEKQSEEDEALQQKPQKAKFEENQSYRMTFRANAFGFDEHRIEVEANSLAAGLDRISKALLGVLYAKQESEKRGESTPHTLSLSNQALRQTLETELSQALAETQRPRNDVTLWDFSHTTGSFFKAAIAWSILDPENELWKKLKTEPEWKKLELDLQFLTVSWNYFQFMQSASRLIDVLSRRRFLESAIQRLRHFLETEVPIANAVFQDENGLVFLAPGGGKEALWACKDKELNLPSLLARFFVEAREEPYAERYAEIVPDIDVFPINRAENDLGFGKTIRERATQHTSDAAGFAKLWEQINPDKSGYDVCPVCGLRPVGYDDNARSFEKAQKRHVCRVCEERRLDRAKEWLDPQHPENYARTIWIDEVADDNGRVALIAGRFHLDDWFDPESKLAESISKVISFARARRIWETTRKFWAEVVADDMMAKVNGMAKRPRWRIVPFAGTTGSLAAHHSYEAEFNGARFPVLWDGEAFHITENVARLEKLRNLAEGTIEEKFPQGQVMFVYQEDLRGQERLASVVQAMVQHAEEKVDAYHPLIEILTQPALAMFLVPAQAALAYAEKIKEKYDREMGKVKDRLPLNLGIVYFPKEIPISAVLDAGRRLVRHHQGPEVWKIEEVKQRAGLDQELNRCEIYYEFIFSAPKREKVDKIAMRFAIARGDGQPDSAHTKFLKYEGDPNLPIDKTSKFTICPIAQLKPGDWVRMAISHFDFVFLDQAGKRFELALPPDAISRYHETLEAPAGPRPYLLENLPQFSELCELLRKLPPGQRASDLHAIRDLLLQKYRAWKLGFGDSGGPAFRSLAEQVVRKEFGPDLDPDDAKKLLAAIDNGIFFDTLELYMHIMKSF